MTTTPILAPYCYLCLAGNVIARKDGPTCTHRKVAGRPAGDWWPEWWQQGPEERRLSWLEQRADKL